MITIQDYELIIITLYATKDELRERAKLRDNNIQPVFHLLEKSLEQESIFIETTKKTPELVADEIEYIINKASIKEL